MVLVKRNTISVYLHLVWATYERHPIVTDALEPEIIRCIHEECQRQKCDVLAIGAMPDHIHLAVSFPATTTIAQLMKQVKGVSSAFARDASKDGNFFGWQEGYGAFSFSPTHRERVVEYIRNQKQHHAENTIWPHAEKFGADASDT